MDSRPNSVYCFFCGKPLEDSVDMCLYGNTNRIVSVCEECKTKFELIYESEEGDKDE